MVSVRLGNDVSQPWQDICTYAVIMTGFFYIASCTLDVAFLFSWHPFAEPWELYESATDSVNNHFIIFYYYLFFFLEIVPV